MKGSAALLIMHGQSPIAEQQQQQQQQHHAARHVLLTHWVWL
jgi:hypothetical protein